ncbi:hypothetical protein KI387_032128, partial [Taxus chinensis]
MFPVPLEPPNPVELEQPIPPDPPPVVGVGLEDVLPYAPIVVLYWTPTVCEVVPLPEVNPTFCADDAPEK